MHQKNDKTHTSCRHWGKSSHESSNIKQLWNIYSLWNIRPAIQVFATTSVTLKWGHDSHFNIMKGYCKFKNLYLYKGPCIRRNKIPNSSLTGKPTRWGLGVVGQHFLGWVISLTQKWCSASNSLPVVSTVHKIPGPPWHFLFAPLAKKG